MGWYWPNCHSVLLTNTLSIQSVDIHPWSWSASLQAHWGRGGCQELQWSSPKLEAPPQTSHCRSRGGEGFWFCEGELWNEKLISLNVTSTTMRVRHVREKVCIVVQCASPLYMQHETWAKCYHHLCCTKVDPAAKNHINCPHVWSIMTLPEDKEVNTRRSVFNLVAYYFFVGTGYK